MNDDVRKYVYGTILVFVIGLFFWIGFVYINACGFSFTCRQGELSIERTPIPTIAHAPNPEFLGQDPAGKCQVPAAELLGAWVTAGSPETEVFTFDDINGNPCEGNFAEDIRPLFVEANIWYPGSSSCVLCHNADIGKTSAANLDLTSYEGIMSGSQRASADASGTDILAGGDWEQSLLYEFTVNRPVQPPGHAEAGTAGPMLVFAGKSNPAGGTGAPSVTPTP